MKKVIRNSVFETNSSSMHSISLYGDNVIKLPEHPLSLECGEFGWEIEEYNDAQSKLSYVLTDIQYKIEQPEWVSKPEEISYNEWDKNPIKIDYEKECERVVIESHWLKWVKEMLVDSGIKFKPETLEVSSGYSKFGYIDHQSTDTLDELWVDDEIKFKENIKEFIFNPNWYLNTDNDNH